MRRGRVMLAAFAALTGIATPAAAAEFYGTVSVTTVDYPEGIAPGPRPTSVRLRFGLGPDGSVIRCEVLRTSGIEALAGASCRILQERARFRPVPGRMTGEIQFDWMNEPDRGPGNPRGAPIPFGFIQQLSPNDYPPAALRARAQGAVTYRVDVSATGVARRCDVIGSSGVPALDERTCALVMARAVYIAASDGQGGRRAAPYTGRITWRIP